MKLLLLILLLSMPLASLAEAILNEARAHRDTRMAWWREAKFGLFVHWGLYSVPAGVWDGQSVPGDSESILANARIKLSDYAKLIPRFCPVRFDARSWVRLAKDASMRYLVFPAKSRDGFCMFNSSNSQWGISATLLRRDPLRELADECRHQGIRLGVYYSTVDWQDPDYSPRAEGVLREDLPEPCFDKHCATIKAQLRELLTGYGHVDVLWLDSDKDFTWSPERAAAIHEYAHTFQRDVVLSNRVEVVPRNDAGFSEGLTLGDFATPEGSVPTSPVAGVDWEASIGLSDSYGYRAHEDTWKSAKQVVRSLVECVSKGGDLLLNVGATGEGVFSEEVTKCLHEIGRWMSLNSEAIYGAAPNPVGATEHLVTGKGRRLFVHVFEDERTSIELPPDTPTIERAFVLADLKRTSLPVQQGASGTLVTLPEGVKDAVARVVVLELAGSLKVAESAAHVA